MWKWKRVQAHKAETEIIKKKPMEENHRRNGEWKQIRKRMEWNEINTVQCDDDCTHRNERNGTTTNATECNGQKRVENKQSNIMESNDNANKTEREWNGMQGNGINGSTTGRNGMQCNEWQ